MHSGNDQTGPLLALHPADNIMVCRQQIHAGDTVSLCGITCRIYSDLGIGHKVACKAIKAGEKILRYGVPIGTLLTDAEPGDHIHTHNLKSDYIPSHSRNAAQIGT